MTADPSLRTVKAWPFEEAAKVADRIAAAGKPAALFETGYGPSGLPHIGTFGEVARTTWVRQAFERMTGLKGRLLAFSDDMDGLRKVPDNVPNGDMLRQHLGKSLTAIPDPFGTHESFGHHNNARLRAFLDAFGFEYEFASATDYYRSGRFDAALLRMLAVHEEVRQIILPTLGPDRRATYSPFLPVHPRTGVVMQVPLEETRPQDGTIVWRDPDSGERFETPVTGGHVKAQWKADWAMRWFALGVDYEMSGKDLIDSVKLSSAICRVLGAEPPVSMTYELFLDAQGQKISKSKGNGLTIEEWLRYAPPESLAYFMYGQPGRAKRLHFDVIPRATDEYLSAREKLRANPDPANPDWHIHGGEVPNSPEPPLTFGMLLNLATVAAADTPERLWKFVRNYAPGATPETQPLLGQLVEYAVAYARDFVLPGLRPRAPTPEERPCFQALIDLLRAHREEIEALPPGLPQAERIQVDVYDAGRREPFIQLMKDGSPGVARGWFNALYQVLVGADQGPRFGSLAAAYGVPETIRLVEEALARPSASPGAMPEAEAASA
ncbi:lysine--tRNA ligase [Pseudoroseomonas rhizosphaerae]|uniref:Lysine--tRNA ligase n=1 Tax=Teichococcus rhizosphaerae TaxID=1335062 RepID=A0A2C7AFH2_9PROT|nr:lysine--tRNA ligase [Pseudoroseomonas rhizosphaerae]PHK95886.1 lysine--tRNA ligase [Pseudoroseomonas rhizosphaerae]